MPAIHSLFLLEQVETRLKWDNELTAGLVEHLLV
jgi:hypothetical protein